MSVSPSPRDAPRLDRRAWERPLQPPEERSRVSLHFASAPSEGCVRPSARWRDLLEDEPPWKGPRAPPTYCVAGPEIVEGGLRIEPSLLVVASDEREVLLEDRLSVTGRMLANVIETERARVGSFVRRTSARSRRLRERGVRKGRKLRRRGGPAALLGLALAWVSRLLHRLANGFLRVVRALTRGVIAFPDHVRTGWGRTVAFLETPEGRRRFVEGLKDPRNLPTRQKAVTLFAAVGALAVTLVLLHVAVTLVAPQHAVAWRRVFLLFVYALVTSLGPPMPLEPVLLAAALYVGRLGTLATVVTAKVLAAWMIFFVGDEVNDRLREEAKTKPWIGKMLDASEAFARRFGVVALAAFIAVPGLPDVVALYLFGTLHMRLPGYLAGVCVGSLILNSVILYGVAPLLGF